MITDVISEISNYAKKLSKISLSTTVEKAKLAAKNEIEKKKKQIELLQSLPDSAKKEKIKEVVAAGNLGVLFADPSNENKEKKSVYNKDEYEKEVAKIVPQLIEIEKQCC